MVTYRDLYSNTKSFLKICGIESHRFEASLLIKKATGIDKQSLAINGDAYANAKQISELSKMLEMRKNREPLQYILGEWEFFGLNFKVGKGVLIPRQDSETIVEAVIEKKIDSPIICDLCSGSGCIAIALEKNIPNSKCYAVEISQDAIKYLKQNIEENFSLVNIIQSDVLNEKTLGEVPKCDVITANPPYLTEQDMQSLQAEVAFEPSLALFGGDDGLWFYRGISALWKSRLKDGGRIFFEVGIGQENDVAEILAENSFVNIEYKKDLCGIIRVVSGEKLSRNLDS